MRWPWRGVVDPNDSNLLALPVGGQKAGEDEPRLKDVVGRLAIPHYEAQHQIIQKSGRIAD